MGLRDSTNTLKTRAKWCSLQRGILSLLGERAYGLHQILKKVCDPQTKNPNLGEHLSHPLELQRRKLRPERDWDLLMRSSQLVKWNPGLRERERALDSGPGPQAQPCLLTNGPN